MALCVSACSSHQSCMATCLDAGGGQACTTLQCDWLHRRCACSAGAMLRRTGTCHDAGGSRVGPVECEQQFRVVFNIAALPSPELSSGLDLATGNVSGYLVAWLEERVVSALGQEVHIAAVEAKTADSKLWGLDGAGILHFDLAFSLCAGKGKPLAPVDWKAFERQFAIELQQFEAFRSSSFSLLRYDFIGRSTPQPSTSPQPGLLPLEHHPRGGPEAPPAKTRRPGWAEAEALAALLTGAAVLLLATALAAAWARRWRRLQRIGPECSGEMHAGSEPSDWVSSFPSELESGGCVAARHLALATQRFTAGDFPDNDAIGDAALALDVGDVVEVLAGEGGWLYGHILDRPEQVGYFPERGVSWLGSTYRGSMGALDLPALAMVQVGFTPSAKLCGEDLEAGGAAVKEVHSSPRKESSLRNASGGTVSGNLAKSVSLSKDLGSPSFVARELARSISASKELRSCSALAWLSCISRELGSRTLGKSGDLESYAADWESCADSGRAVEEIGCASEPGCKDFMLHPPNAACCLSLKRDEVVEVIAAGNGWLYGRALHAPGRAGFFPEACVAWLGRGVLQAAAQGDECPAGPEVLGARAPSAPQEPQPQPQPPPPRSQYHEPPEIPVPNLE